MYSSDGKVYKGSEYQKFIFCFYYQIARWHKFTRVSNQSIAEGFKIID
jgi:hypothetical protein